MKGCHILACMTRWWQGRLDSLARELFQLEGRNQTSGQEFTSCRHQRGTETGAVGFVQGGVFSLSTLGQLGSSEMNGELDLFTYYPLKSNLVAISLRSSFSNASKTSVLNIKASLKCSGSLSIFFEWAFELCNS